MFVISMAGLSSRFFDAGYKQPKYTLQAFGESLFSHAMRSFENYFDNTPFLFITLDQFDSIDFVRAESRSIGIENLEIVTLDEPTRGQAETVFLGLQSLDLAAQPITIFNIDTATPNFRHPEFADECDGYLDVFIGSGPNWSYVKPASPDSNRVIETAEKNPISNLCSTGLYYFSSSDDFCTAYKQQIDAGNNELTGSEIYVAPLYNFLIDSGKDIRYRVVDQGNVIFFGTPTEYESLLSHPDSYLNREWI